jgi:hypothetical protein
MMYQAWSRPGIWRERVSGSGMIPRWWMASRLEEGTYVTQDQEKDVDDGVGRADAALDPDCEEPVLAGDCLVFARDDTEYLDNTQVAKGKETQ